MFKKYHKIRPFGFRENENILFISGNIVVQEKVDGANFGFFVEEDALNFCSHNKNLTNTNQIAKTGIPKKWRAIEPILESFNRDSSKFKEGLYYYGESLQKHKIQYDNIPGFIGFDILDIRTDRLLNYTESREIFKSMGLPFIHIYYEGNANSITYNEIDAFHENSNYKIGKAEGVVIKSYEHDMYAKIVDESFKEISKLPKSTIDKTSEMMIADTYATDGRIEKIVYKLVDDGGVIGMRMMKDLMKAVAEDILDEQILEIYKEYKNINFRTFDNIVAKKCAVVLKGMISKS